MPYKSFVLTCFTLVIISHFSGCSKKDNTPQPVAGFTFSAAYNNNTHAPATISFTNTSTDAYDYLWDFGDGTTSTATSTSHKYTTAGNYTVKLKSSASGESNTISKTVNILPAYTQAKVSKFTLVSTSQSFPFNGFFRVTDGSGTQVYKSPVLTFNGPSYYTPPSPPSMSNLSGTYNIEIWKYGTVTDAKLNFTPVLLYLMNTGTSTSSSYPTNPPSATGSGLDYNLTWE